MKHSKIILLFSFLISTSTAIFASEDSGWFLRPTFGLSNLSDTSGELLATPDGASRVTVATESGFATGLGLGYQYNPNLAVEIFWEYRTNDSDSQLVDNTIYSGNYASNVFYLNGYYYFDSESDWSTYVGAGIGWVQEIDLDWEVGSMEESYSSDGDSSFQVFAGTQYKLTEQWDFQLELRYGNASSINMNNEISDIPLNGLDYKTTTVQLGFVYNF